MSWLLDTGALSEYAKKAPAPKVIAWLDEQDEENLYISVISLGEIGKGILELRASDRRRSQKLTAWLGKVEQRFAGCWCANKIDHRARVQPITYFQQISQLR